MHHSTIEQIRARRWQRALVAFSTAIFSGVLLRPAFSQPTVPPSMTATESATDEDEPIQMMEYFVQERGVSRATNTVTAQDVQIALPGANVIQLLRNVPGVNITTTDPFGFAPEGGDIRVRSFGISVLAVTIDDVPMGSNSSRYGTPASRIVDGENLASIQVSQGTGDVTTPAFEALGGSIKYYTIDPKREMGLFFKQSLGTWDFNRTFVRFDTGELFPGFTSFIGSSQQTFKTLGMPQESEVRKLDLRLRYELPSTTLSYSFTWSDRDDFDSARSIRWDRWRAIETGDAFAGYAVGRYGAADQNNLHEFARLGYAEYTRTNSSLATELLKNYGDQGRLAVRRTTLDSSVNLGDAPNSDYYYYGRNGRMDGFSRFVADHSFSDALTGKLVTYYQHKQYYGTAYTPRSTPLTNIANAYRQGTPGVIRTDIWPRYAYMDAARTQLVPYGTPGALPVGFTDGNGNGIFDPGEKLDPMKDVTPFTPTGANAHALIAPTSTTLQNATTAIPGASARDEDFGGYRWGFFPQATWILKNHKLTGGAWYERDVQTTTRPQYNLSEGSPTGRILYDQVQFNSYERYFLTKSTMVFLEDVSQWMDDRLTVTLGWKALETHRSVDGMIDGTLWFRPIGQQYAKNEVTYKDTFLPQAGVSYKLNNDVELFASYARNIAAPAQDVITSLGFSQGLVPEEATNYDVGVRYATSNFGATAAIFYNAYEERLLTVPLTLEEQIALGIQGVVGTAIYRNVGGIDSTGAELSFDWRTPLPGLRMTGSVAYQNSEFTDDLRVAYQSFMANPNDPRSRFYVPIPNGGATPVFATELQAGKSQGNTPEITANIDLTYAWKNLSLNFGGRYYDEVWANTMNTELVPSYTTFRAGASWRGPRGSRFEPFTLSITADNVFDQYFFTSSAGTGAFDGTVTADYGRTVIVTLEARF